MIGAVCALCENAHLVPVPMTMSNTSGKDSLWSVNTLCIFLARFPTGLSGLRLCHEEYILLDQRLRVPMVGAFSQSEPTVALLKGLCAEEYDFAPFSHSVSNTVPTRAFHSVSMNEDDCLHVCLSIAQMIISGTIAAVSRRCL